MLNNAESLQRAGVRQVLIAAVSLVGMTVGVASGCTQDFDQFSPSATGGTGALGGGGAGMGGSTDGGGGGDPECTSDAQCDDFNPCTDDTCSGSGTCVNDAIPDGLEPDYADLPGDCVDNRCEDGVLMEAIADDTETPEDGNPCTDLTCSGGAVQTENKPVDFDCGPNPPSNLACNDMGQCIGCMGPTDCPGVDDFCGTRTCDANMVCGTTFTAAQTPLPAGQQDAGDCQELRCDGAGMTISVNFNTDVPNDNNVCTTDTCAAGNPTHTPITPGNPCLAGPGVCNSATPPSCVECVGQAQCTMPETCGGGNPGTPNVCGCTPDSPMMTCDPACGMVTNNCGTTVTCTCTNPSDVCFGGTCCVEDAPATTCGAFNCGTVNNNCGVPVSCGTCMAPTPTCTNNMCE